MSWQDFDTDSALERDTLERAVPLVETESTGAWGAVLNMTGEGDPGEITILLESIPSGATAEACIDLLRLRPLLFGTAWRVLDLLIDGALDAAGVPPDRKNGGWWIETKVKEVRNPAIRPAAVSAPVWHALTATYTATVELRHCLVHRGVSTDPSGALIWHDKQRRPGRPVTQEEQEAFVRAVLRASQLVVAPVPEERSQDDLMYQLGLLAGVHGVALGQVPQHLRLARLTVIIGADPATPGSYLLDVPAVKAKSPWPDATWVDLIVQLKGRPGQELRGRLEHAPNEVAVIDPAAPPSWLS